MTEHPNILLVVADQLAAAGLASYGNPLTRAPTLDRLAAEGVVFEHAYCASPLCVPSRGSLLTSMLPSRTGAIDNGAELAASVPTFAHYLRVRGYRTVLAGKMHFVGPDQMHGFEERVTADVYPAGLDWVPDWNLSSRERLPWYHDMSSVQRAGAVRASLQLDYDEEVGVRGSVNSFAMRSSKASWSRSSSSTPRRSASGGRWPLINVTDSAGRGLEEIARALGGRLGLRRLLVEAEVALHRLELAAQRFDNHAVDQYLDGCAVRVVRAELRPLARVQAALEEGAEDGRLDLRPVELGDRADGVDLRLLQGEHLRAVEQAAVEPLHPFGTEEAAALR